MSKPDLSFVVIDSIYASIGQAFWHALPVYALWAMPFLLIDQANPSIASAVAAAVLWVVFLHYQGWSLMVYNRTMRFVDVLLRRPMTPIL